MSDNDADDETTFWRDQRGDGRKPQPPDIDVMRLEAGAVRCRRCFAAVDRDCINPLTGKPLKHLPCHPVRLSDARKANA